MRCSRLALLWVRRLGSVQLNAGTRALARERTSRRRRRRPGPEAAGAIGPIARPHDVLERDARIAGDVLGVDEGLEVVEQSLPIFRRLVAGRVF